MCCLRLTHIRYKQNAFTQSEYKTLNYGSRVKIPTIKINCDNISDGKSLRLSIIPNITFIILFRNSKNVNIFKVPITFQNFNFL